MKTNTTWVEYSSFTRKQIENFILKGKVYAQIESVSRSWMSRKIWFWVVYKWTFINISKEINFMYNKKEQNYWEPVKVGGCGMDMIFHVLYVALWYEKAKTRNQNYKRY